MALKNLTMKHSISTPPSRLLKPKLLEVKAEEKKGLQSSGSANKQNQKSKLIKTRESKAEEGKTVAYAPSIVKVIQDLTKFVPSLVIQRLITRAKKQKSQPQQLPELQHMETVVIFADISGFTNLSESCAKKGRVGNEDLAFCINRYMEDMVSCLNQYGGDIIKFVGDAMIVMWPPLERGSEEFWRDRLDTIRKALQCTQEIQKRLNNQQIMPGVTLSVKIGVAFGKCAILYVGGVFDRQETLTVGEALEYALKSEGQAEGGGQVIVSETCFKHVLESGNFNRGQEIIDNDGHKYYKLDLTYRGQRVAVKADMMKILAQYSVRELQEAQEDLEMNVVRCAIPFIKINQQQYASEIRALTIMFVNLGIDLSSASEEAGIQKIQQIMVAVQQQVYRLQGAINKLVMDDKGSTLICIFGLPPYAHDDDASRAIFTGFNMIKALQAIDRRIYCNIGIASGECFCGIVGGSGSRKEFSVLGDIVNLSARIMGSMKGTKNQITCDLNTRMLAASNFTFSYTGHRELKGKMISSPFFKPTSPDVHTSAYLSKMMPYEFFLWPQQNALLLEREVLASKPASATVGFESLLDEMKKEALSYFADFSNIEPYVAIIQGEIGAGKTAFMRHLFQELKQSEQFAEYVQYNKGNLPIFASSLNSETRLHFLNAWRPIFVMLIKFFCKQKQIDKHHFVADFIKKEQAQELSDLIIEITGVDKNQMRQRHRDEFKKYRQVEMIQQENAFCKTPQLRPEVNANIVKHLVHLFKYCVGDASEVESDWSGSDENGSGKISAMKKKSNSRAHKSNNFMTEDSDSDGSPADPIIICIDNAHLMDATSWKLFGDLVNEEAHVAFYLIIKIDYRDRLLIVPEAKDAFDKAWLSMAQGVYLNEHDECVDAQGRQNFRRVELPDLTNENIREIILRSAVDYRRTHLAEVESMTKIEDPESTIKNLEASREWKESLIQKWQLHVTYSDIDPLIVSVIQRKCRGNPFLCLDYFKQMLHSGFIFVSETGYLTPSDQFKRCNHFKDWSPVLTPFVSKRICAQILSNFIHQVSSKRPGYLELAATAVVLLKTASVLGREFSVDALKHISPLTKDTNHDKRVDDAIAALEKADLLEIVDQGAGRTTRCRFVQTLMCETLYQMVRYKAIKRDLHTKVEEFIQHHPEKMVKQANISLDELLLWHMLLAQDCQTEEQLFLERRNSLTVMRVQNLVDRKPQVKVLMKDILYKAPSTGIHSLKSVESKKVDQRFLILTRDQLIWYHDLDEAKTNNFIGRTELKFIYDTMKVPLSSNGKDKPLYAFQLEVSMHELRNKKDAGRRTIILASESALVRDQWLAAIDYLKLRAIYVAYKKNNQLVHFLMSQSQSMNDKVDEDQKQNQGDLIYDFGGKLIANTVKSVGYKAKPMDGHKFSFANNLQSKASILRRGTALISEISGKQEFKAQDLVARLRLLYKVGITSFLFQLNVASTPASNQVFTSDEDVERLPMQFPQNSINMMKREIATIENIPYEETNQRFSFNSSRQSVSMASRNKLMNYDEKRKTQMNQPRISLSAMSLDDDFKMDAAKKTDSFVSQDLSQTEIQEITPTASLQGYSRFSSIDNKPGQPRSHASLAVPAEHDPRLSSVSEDVQQFRKIQSNCNHIAEEDHEDSESDHASQCSDKSGSRSLAENYDGFRGMAADVNPGGQMQRPRKSDSNAHQVAMLQQQMNADSGEQVSELLENIGVRTVDLSEVSQNANQNQYDTSNDAAAAQGGNRQLSGQISRQNDNRKLREMIAQQQVKIEEMIKQQQSLMQQVSMHQSFLSPTSSAQENGGQINSMQKIEESKENMTKTSPIQMTFDDLEQRQKLQGMRQSIQDGDMSTPIRPRSQSGVCGDQDLPVDSQRPRKSTAKFPKAGDDIQKVAVTEASEIAATTFNHIQAATNTLSEMTSQRTPEFFTRVGSGVLAVDRKNSNNSSVQQSNRPNLSNKTMPKIMTFGYNDKRGSSDEERKSKDNTRSPNSKSKN